MAEGLALEKRHFTVPNGVGVGDQGRYGGGGALSRRLSRGNARPDGLGIMAFMLPHCQKP